MLNRAISQVYSVYVSKPVDGHIISDYIIRATSDYPISYMNKNLNTPYRSQKLCRCRRIVAIAGLKCMEKIQIRRDRRAHVVMAGYVAIADVVITEFY